MVRLVTTKSQGKKETKIIIKSLLQTIYTFHIHLSGIVQGIGFRPYVVQLAKEYQLKGWINNSADGVHIEINASEEKANLFYNLLLKKPPRLATIIHHQIYQTESKIYTHFTIVNSSENTVPDILLTPDYALCQSCQQELHAQKNRRFRYPFITCTQCGPRYSITTKLPYDRENTTMRSFIMCQSCQQEYGDSTNKRYFSQTNSCPYCSITLQLYTGLGIKLSEDNNKILNSIPQYISEGKIIALKGIGGYVLLCDATKITPIQVLRKRKNRPSKPFALLFKDILHLKNYAFINNQEEESLCSEVAPIVLVKNKPDTSLVLNEIAPKLHHIGCMLPNTPLLELITQMYDHPLVCTSANISNSPIFYKDEEALLFLNIIADYIITHNREIVTPQDESVIQYTKEAQKKIIHRRSRGLAPTHLGYLQKGTKSLVATGSLMKSTFTLQTNNKTYISQYLGSTDSIEAQQSFRSTLAHLQTILSIKPQQFIADKHPDYYTTLLANELNNSNDNPVIQVQHHKAHFTAVLAENNLLQNKEVVLGVIWDGAGLGEDGQIWGSEFFTYENNIMRRCYHFDYFPLLFHDKMAKEPRISAMAICKDVMESDELLQNKFSTTEWTLYKKILASASTLKCCSMGRIFDAVASLLNLCDKQNYEGEAALYLQTLAETYTNQNGYAMQESYFTNDVHLYCIPTTTLLTEIIKDCIKKKERAFIAAKFHFSLVHSIEIVADTLGIKNIACSGGVFQNSLLVDMTQQLLKEKFGLFFHKQLSPNDENISFGQMVFYDQNIDTIQELNKKKINSKNENICV